MIDDFANVKTLHDLDLALSQTSEYEKQINTKIADIQE